MADRTASRPGARGRSTTGRTYSGSAALVHRLWDGEGGPLSRLLGWALTPAELVYRGAVAFRGATYRSGLATVAAPPVPTISVGNITVGGTGKTPLVRWLVTRLVEQGLTPGILHGGYAQDEPTLHRLWFPELPVVADRNRGRGAHTATGEGADILVLDDGFQHRALARDLDIVLVSAETWSRSARLLPRGPYRESPRALARAHLVMVTRKSAGPLDAARAEAEIAALSGRPTARAHLRPTGWLDRELKPRDRNATPGEAVAVAGVARPSDFFDHARRLGARVVDEVAFPDHHDYTPAEATALTLEAAGRSLVTTAKDVTKLASLMPQVDLWVLDQEVTIESGRDRVLQALEEISP